MEHGSREGGGGGRSGSKGGAILEAAILAVFHDAQQVLERQQQQEQRRNPATATTKGRGGAGSGGRKKGRGGGGGGGGGVLLDKRELMERLRGHRGPEDIDQAALQNTEGQEREDEAGRGVHHQPARLTAAVDDRSVSAALKRLVSRGVLGVHQGQWRLIIPAVPAPSDASMTGHEREEDAVSVAARTRESADGDGDDDDDGMADMHAIVTGQRKKNKKWEALPHGITEILTEFLYLGSARDAEDEMQLSALGITHVLNVAKEWARPRHCTFLTTLKEYKQVGLEDRLSERLFPALEDALDFIHRVGNEPGTKPKLLIHCVLGKSRSASVAIAYLVKHNGMTLQEAYHHVLERRRGIVAIRPNRSFTEQLMSWEVSLGSGRLLRSTLCWDDVDTGITNFHEWLIANDVSSKGYSSGSRSKKGNMATAVEAPKTHLWWTLGDKPEYSIPIERTEELMSEYAKAVLRGEKLFLIERRTSPAYNLYFDLDIKCSFTEGRSPLPLEDILQIFLPSFATVYRSFFDVGTEDVQQGSTGSQLLSISGAAGPFSFAPLPEVNWKYGFHLIWNNVEITTHKHRAFHNALLKHMEPLWSAPDLSDSQDSVRSRLPDFIREYNELAQVLDTAIFTSTDTLRVLYSNKLLACKSCKSRQPTNTRKGRAPTKKGVKKGKECDECKGTGLREGRPYEWLGHYDPRTGVRDTERSAPLAGDHSSSTGDPTDLKAWSAKVRLVRKRVEACSIRLQNRPPASSCMDAH